MPAVDYATLYADADTMRNHWWWRPGWHIGTRYYAWHLTLDGQDDLHRLIDTYQAALADDARLDPVPRQWRHITMTGIGHAQDVPDKLLQAAAENVRARLADFPPLTATFQHASIFTEAIALGPDNPDAFTALQNAAQQATAEVISGADKHNPRFRAHVSTHYNNSEHPSAAVRAALDHANPAPAVATFTSLDLIRMHRDHSMYEWALIDRVPLGRQPGA